MPRDCPLISIIIAVINGAGVLGRCLDSIAAQSFQDFEVIVIDGGSADGTVELIRERAGAIAYWESGPDRGVYHAWNKALPHARGDWICFLGADDRLAGPAVLEQLAARLPPMPAARAVYGRLNIVAADGRVLEAIERPWPRIRAAFLAGLAMIPHSGLFHHRSLFEERGRYDESFRIAGDYDLLLRELRTRDAVYLANITTVDMQIGGLSATPENLLLALQEIRRARINNGLPAASPRLAAKIVMARVGYAVYRIAGERALRLLTDLFRLLTLRRRKWTV